MRRAFVPLALAAGLLASVAGAQLAQTFKDFPNGPAGFVMTDNEKKAFAQLKSDSEAQAWIELFWAKRDPDLNTVENEFKQDFDARVLAADKQFSTEKIKGSMSDRGKVLILMGKPLSVKNQAAGAEDEEGNRPAFIERGATQVWMYTKDGKPPAKKTDAILFVFSETRVGAGDFLLDRADMRNKLSLKLLAARADELLRNPKLTEVPRMGLLPGTKAATMGQQAIFDTQPRPWPQQGAAILTASGFRSESSHPIWIWLQLPDAVPPATQAIGRVRKAEGGDVVGSFASPVTPLSVPGGRAYEFSLPAEAGAWKVDLALSNDAGPIAITTAEAKNEPAPVDGPYISPIIWSADIRQSGQAHLGDAFHLGAMQMIPPLDNKYKQDESITYGAYVVRPSLMEPPVGQCVAASDAEFKSLGPEGHGTEVSVKTDLSNMCSDLRKGFVDFKVLDASGMELDSIPEVFQVDPNGDTSVTARLTIKPEKATVFKSVRAVVRDLTGTPADAKPRPRIELKIALYSGGKKHDEQAFQAVPGLKITGDIWVYGQQLPLSGFRRGMDFELEVTLRDAKTGVQRTQKIPFTVVKDEPAAAAPAPAAPPK